MRSFWILFLMILSHSIYSTPPIHLDFQSALTRCLSENMDITIRISTIEQQKRSNILNLRQFFPELSLSFGENKSVTTGSNDSHRYQLGLNLRQPLFTGGRGSVENQMSDMALSLEEEELKSQIDELKNTIWNIYNETAMAKEKLQLHDESLVTAQHQLELAKLRFNQGSLTRLELAESELYVDYTRLENIELKIELDKMFMTLSQLLNYPAEMTYILEAPAFSTYHGIENMPNLNVLTSMGREFNSELRSMSFEIRKKKEQLSILQRAYIPQIYLEAAYSIGGSCFPLHDTSFSLSLEASIEGGDSTLAASSINSFSSNTHDSSSSLEFSPLESFNLEIQKENIRIELLVLRRNLDSLNRDYSASLSILLNLYQLKKEQLKLSRRNLELGLEKEELMMTRWGLGEITHKEVMELQRENAANKMILLGQIMELKIQEREIEKIVGLPPNNLGVCCE